MPFGSICGIDADKLVESREGQSLLLTDTSPIGVIVHPRIHQRGVINYSDLKPEVDLELDDKEPEHAQVRVRFLELTIEISKREQSPFISLILHEVRYSGPVLRCEVYKDAASDVGVVERTGGCLPLNIGTSETIHIRLAISERAANNSDISGFLALVLQGEEKGPTILFKRVSTLITGAFVSARVLISEAPSPIAAGKGALSAFLADDDGTRQLSSSPSPSLAPSSSSSSSSFSSSASSVMALSSEAPVFVSRRDKGFFDLPGFIVSDLFYDLNMLEQAFGISPTSPLGEIVARVVESVRTHGASFKSPKEIQGVSLHTKYAQCLEEHLRFGRVGNAFAAITAYSGIKILKPRFGHVAEADSSRLAWPFKHLAFSFMLEEMQMHLDEQNYDYHYTEVAIPSPSRGDLLIIEFTAPGSAESRPSVQIGNIVRLRPVQEHWGIFREYYYGFVPNPSTDNAQYNAQYPIPELRGVVINYVLKTERVILRLCEPSRGEVRRPSPGLLAAARFHVRFELDRTAFYFAQETLSFICSEAKQAQTLRDVLQPIYTPILKDWPNAAGYACHASVLPILMTLNEEQSVAVRSICAMQAASVTLKRPLPPFCLYGPPGTGKTTTLIRAIEALLVQSSKTSILACAPSDAAADVLCIKLHELFRSSQKKVKIIRMNWWKRVRSSVPIQILQYCCLFNEIFQMPAHSALNAEQIIVVCTCGAAGMLSKRKTFDYVFIDEASQASEAESLTACCLADPHKGVIVLAGDPKQLGPGCRSPANVHLLSLLERLLSSTAYGNFVHPNQTLPNSEEPGRLTYDNRMVLGTYLVRNYRSHKDIIALPSDMFYRSSLRPCGDEAETHAVIGKQWMRALRAGSAAGAVSAAVETVRLSALGQGARKEKSEEAGAATVARTALGAASSIAEAEDRITTRSGAIFVSVMGKHRHEHGSPSFFNDDEIFEIKELISSLIAADGIVPRASTKDFCVICSFRSQTLRMRTFLRENGLGNVDVGAVEDYQGQERRYTIISTVLSSRPRMLSGISESYGLLSHARRFNVAVTRAKALCIVVGNPNLLLGDPYWRAYIEACDEREAYYGQVSPLLRRRQKELRSEFVKSGGVDTVLNTLLLTTGVATELTATSTTGQLGPSTGPPAPRPPGLSIDENAVISASVAAAETAAEDAAMEENFFRINFDAEWRAML